jgi:hypothetical protein
VSDAELMLPRVESLLARKQSFYALIEQFGFVSLRRGR